MIEGSEIEGGRNVLVVPPRPTLIPPQKRIVEAIAIWIITKNVDHPGALPASAASIENDAVDLQKNVSFTPGETDRVIDLAHRFATEMGIVPLWYYWAQKRDMILVKNIN